jgi:flavin-dependent dehydrogenase
MGQKTDVFVVGGGPAGLAAAIAARQRGFNVVVADGAEPPIDKACGEGLMPDTLAVLRNLGVSLNPSDGFAFRGVRFIGEGTQVEGSFPMMGQGIGLRRPVLHQRMIEQAEKVGVTLLWRTCVTGLLSQGVSAGGKIIRARWIIGADGIRSRVRRWCDLHGSVKARPRFAFRRHYRVKPWTDCVEVYWGRSAQAYVTPVGPEDLCVVLISRNAAVRSASMAEDFPELAGRLAAAVSGPDEGAVTLTCGFGRVHRNNVALIGDASGSVDAITGEGLGLGFRQATALADALAADDLRQYQAAHRRLARRPMLMGRLLLLLDSQAKVRHRALRALAEHPELFARLVSVHVGATSPGHIAATGALLGWRLVAA